MSRTALASKRWPIKNGFTLIELLVVIAIISLLASIVLASLRETREKAMRARALQEMVHIRNAIGLLELDTGKRPWGCVPGSSNQTQSIGLNDLQAGLRSQPDPAIVPTGSAGSCGWTAEDVARWRGPYVDFDLVDPWGHPYYFDGTYMAYANRTGPSLANPSTDPEAGPGTRSDHSRNKWGCPQAAGSPVDNYAWGIAPPTGYVRPALVSLGPPPWPGVGADVGQTNKSYDATCVDSLAPGCYRCTDVFLYLTGQPTY